MLRRWESPRSKPAGGARDPPATFCRYFRWGALPSLQLTSPSLPPSNHRLKFPSNPASGSLVSLWSGWEPWGGARALGVSHSVTAPGSSPSTSPLAQGPHPQGGTMTPESLSDFSSWKPVFHLAWRSSGGDLPSQAAPTGPSSGLGLRVGQSGTQQACMDPFFPSPRGAQAPNTHTRVPCDTCP